MKDIKKINTDSQIQGSKPKVSRRLKIKVCGMREYENVKQLVQLPVDYIGFIFYPPSPRYVGSKIDPSILEIIPGYIQKVGVFVDCPLKGLLRTAEENRLDCVQLHGSEIPDYCEEVMKRGFKVIKAFKVGSEMNICETAGYQPACNYFLFDTPGELYGGSGQKFNWEILQHQKPALPYFISGGISPVDASTIKSLCLEGLYAIDINSKFEIKPGIKDIGLIKNFINDLN